MAKGGFKILVNGRVVRCHKFEADYDSATIVFDRSSDPQKTPKAEDFDRAAFAAMTVTSEDSPE